MWTRADIQKIYGLDRNYLNRLADGDEPLLKPSKTDGTERQTFLYDDEEMERLWLIQLLHKEMGYPLKKVRSILDDPQFDRQKCLGERIQELKDKVSHLNKVIEVAETMKISGLMPQEIMNIENMSAHEFVEVLPDKLEQVSVQTSDKLTAALSDVSFRKALDKIAVLQRNGADYSDAEVIFEVKAMIAVFNKQFGNRGWAGLEQFAKLLRAKSEISAHFAKSYGSEEITFIGTAIIKFIEGSNYDNRK